MARRSTNRRYGRNHNKSALAIGRSAIRFFTSVRCAAVEGLCDTAFTIRMTAIQVFTAVHAAVRGFYATVLPILQSHAIHMTFMVFSYSLAGFFSGFGLAGSWHAPLSFWWLVYYTLLRLVFKISDRWLSRDLGGKVLSSDIAGMLRMASCSLAFFSFILYSAWLNSRLGSSVFGGFGQVMVVASLVWAQVFEAWYHLVAIVDDWPGQDQRTFDKTRVLRHIAIIVQAIVLLIAECMWFVVWALQTVTSAVLSEDILLWRTAVVSCALAAALLFAIVDWKQLQMGRRRLKMAWSTVLPAFGLVIQAGALAYMEALHLPASLAFAACRLLVSVSWFILQLDAAVVLYACYFCYLQGSCLEWPQWLLARRPRARRAAAGTVVLTSFLLIPRLCTNCAWLIHCTGLWFLSMALHMPILLGAEGAWLQPLAPSRQWPSSEAPGLVDVAALVYSFTWAAKVGIIIIAGTFGKQLPPSKPFQATINLDRIWSQRRKTKAPIHHSSKDAQKQDSKPPMAKAKQDSFSERIMSEQFLRHVPCSCIIDLRPNLSLMKELGLVAISCLKCIVLARLSDLKDERFWNPFLPRLAAALLGQHPDGFHAIKVRREHLVEDSISQLASLSLEDLRTSKIHVTFEGEEGLDGGGLGRDWFQQLAVNLEGSALFVRSVAGAVMPAPLAKDVVFNPKIHMEYRAVGRLLGLALLHKVPCPLPLQRLLWKVLLDESLSFEDVQEIDPDFVRHRFESVIAPGGLKAIEGALGGPLLFESVETNDRSVEPLWPHDGGEAVTEETLHEYVALALEHYVAGQRRHILQALRDGFWDVAPLALLKELDFTPAELELCVAGEPQINVQEWRRSATFGKIDAQIQQDFWEIVTEMDTKHRSQLLQFATGSGRVPLGSFMNVNPRFNITSGDNDKLPSAHTCANMLVLPRGPLPKPELERRLHLAISEGRAFCFV